MMCHFALGGQHQGEEARVGLMKGKVVAITGAGRGIGREVALLAAREGASVVVNDLGASEGGAGADVSPAHEVAELIKAGGGSAVVNGADISDPVGAASIVEDAVRHFGHLDTVINTAGILSDRIFHKMSNVDWEHVIQI